MHIQTTLTPRQEQQVAAIVALNLNDEKRRLQAPNADELEWELKKFLIMQAVEPGEYVIAGDVDNLWHLMLENGQKVKDLEAKTGVRVEHKPSGEAEVWNRLAGPSKALYKKLFGPMQRDLDPGMLCWGCGYDISVH